MKICIYGLGAIGGLIGARLAAAGLPVSAVARGATLAALRERGLELIESQGGEIRRVALTAHDDPRQLGPQDLVVLSVKTTALPDVAAQIAPLLGPDTTVLSAMNGVPWWFFHGLRAETPGWRLDSTDPGGVLAANIPVRQVLGCVTHLSAAVESPGVVRRVAGNRLIVGEPSGGATTPRAQSVVAVLRQAGFEVEEAESIQQQIWFKLWGNMTVNPISALTGATGDRILDDDLVRAFMSRCMLEASRIGAEIALPIDADPEARHAVTRKLGAFRTSMLQDVESGRAVELDALLGAVLEIARKVEVATPNLETLFGMARLQARTRGLY
jgi:2-dehydropantoate 2-reductase